MVPLYCPHRRTRPLGRARPCLDLHFHDPLGGEGQHFAHKIAIGLLFNQLE